MPDVVLAGPHPGPQTELPRLGQDTGPDLEQGTGPELRADRKQTRAGQIHKNTGFGSQINQLQVDNHSGLGKEKFNTSLSTNPSKQN